jgi:hypothetical protein
MRGGPACSNDGELRADSRFRAAGSIGPPRQEHRGRSTVRGS